MVNFTHKSFKTILNRSKFIDSWFWTRFTLNAYNGCQIGCVYCDSRSQKYYLPLHFEQNIIIKSNAAKLLDKKLSNSRNLLPDVVGLSGSTDPYQPAERKFKNTLRCLKILNKYQYPVHLISKSDLILRDIVLLEEIGKNSWCSVSTTITTTDEKISKFLEKKASSPEKRFSIIRRIKEETNNIQTGVLLMPIIPYLTDTEDNLRSLISAAKESNADYILFTAGMTMRDLQANWFLRKLRKQFPNLIKKYEVLYDFTYNPDEYKGKYNPKTEYYSKINDKISDLCKKYGLQIRMKRFIPKDYRLINYLIAEKLLNDAYELQSQNKPYKKMYWVGQNIQNLTESIITYYNSDSLSNIANITDEITKFVKDECEKLKKTEIEYDPLDNWF